jgi:tetratricopeptide (TPR) repeat protein
MTTPLVSGQPAAAIGRWEHFSLRWRAKILLTLGMRSAALDLFRQILAKLPDDVHALNSMAYDALQTGHPAQALPLFERVAQLSPELSNSHFNLAFVSEELGHLAQAAIAIEDKMDRAWYGLGLVLVRLGRHEEALVALKRNTSLQPMSPHGWYQMARIHVDMKRPEEAMKLIDHLKGFEPKVAAQLERETGLRAGQAG